MGSSRAEWIQSSEDYVWLRVWQFLDRGSTLSIETLLSSFGFKLRSVVNFLVSVYAVAVAFSFLGYGCSGIENVASGLGMIGLDSLASQLESSYTTVRSLTGVTHYFLALLVGAWLVISCIFFAHTYKSNLPQNINIAPNSVFGVMTFFCLSIDLLSPGSPQHFSLIPIILSVAWSSFKAAKIGPRANILSNSFGVAVLMILGLVFVLLYAALLIPLWFAQGAGLDSDSNEHQHD